MILAGDIGGTKTHLAIYPSGAPARRPAFDRIVASHEYASFEALVREFLDAAGDGAVKRAVLGVAGPVVENHCESPHLSWSVDGDVLSRALAGAEVTLFNDLVTTGFGVEVLGPDDLDPLQHGNPTAGHRAILAAGTGLGEVTLLWDGARWRPAASEGGHADFAPRRPLEDELNLWLRATYGRVSVERVLSGPGLADLHRFLRDTHRGDEPSRVAERFDRAADPAVVVSETGLDGSCTRARMALEIFVEVLGAEAGNLALRALPTRGLYLGGGIAPRLRAVLHDPRFLQAFRDKPPMTGLLERFPVHLILDPRTALWGAAVAALAKA